MLGRRTLLCALLLVGPALADDDPPAPRLVLSTTEARYAFGEVPTFQLAFRSGTAAPLPVVLPCDGSQHGLRTPTYAWTLERVDGAPVAREMLGLCGTVNPLLPSDFQVVEPAATLPIPVGQGWLGPPGFAVTWLEPGRYRVQLAYRWDPSRIDLALVPAEVAARIKACPALELTTTPIEFEIAPPSEAQAARLAAWRKLAQEALGPGEPGEGEADEPQAPPVLDEARVRAALGEPDAREPWGHGEVWRYGLGAGLWLTVQLQEGAVAGCRASYR